MFVLHQFAHPEQRAVWLRTVRLKKARSREIVSLLTSQASARDVEIEDPHIDPEITNGRPVRWFLRRTVAYATGYFTSIKTDEVIAWESRNERNALSILECDPSVSSFTTQPFTIAYPWQNRERPYTPDILVWCGRQPLVVEIKGLIDTNPEAHLLRRLFEAYFAQFDIPYLVWDRSTLDAQPRLSNAQLLLRAKDRIPAAEERLRVLSHLDKVGSASISQLAHASEVSDGDRLIHALLLRGILAMDMNQPLSLDTQVYRYAGDSR